MKSPSQFSEARLLDLSSEAIFVRDSRDRIVYWNGGAEALYGWPREEAMGLDISDLLKNQPGCAISKTRAALEHGGEWQGELVRTRRDGRRLHVLSRCWSTPAAEGASVVEIDTDITALKYAEAARVHFRSLFESTAGAYVVLTPHDHEIVAVSDTYLRAISADRSIIGNKLFDVLAGAPCDTDADGIRNLRASLARVESTLRADAMAVQCYPVPCREGGGGLEDRYWSPINAPVFGPTGEIIFIMHRVEDVTPFVLAKRKEAQEGEAMQILDNRAAPMEAEIVRRTQELSSANEQLRETEARFRLLADTIPQLAWMARSDGWTFWYNRRWYEFTGTTPEEMEGWGWQSVHDPAELDRVMKSWKEALAQEKSWEDTFPLRRHDGEFRWHLSRAMPFRDAEGKIVLWFGTNTDITDLVRAEEAALSANRAKDQFIARLSHELRTPLTPVLAVVSYLAKQSNSLPRELRAEIEMIQRNVELEARLIDDLLDATRIASGKLELALEATDAHAAIRDAFDICAESIRTKQLSVAMNLDASQHVVMADAVRLHQVFWNIINNAVKFTAPNGEITIRSRNEGHDIVVEVQDSGIGFEPEQLGHIFDPFEQGERAITREFGGLGLGLTITKSLVDAHQGRLEATSPGKDGGATFKISFSTRREDVEATGGAPESGRTPPRLRILVVDDHEDTRRTVSKLLRTRGHEVFTAGRVVDALTVLTRESVDVLLSDVGLPDGTGYELMERAMDVQSLTGIALSGFGMAEDVERAMAAGFVHHMIKPVRFEQLERVLNQLTPRATFEGPTGSERTHRFQRAS